MTNTTSWSALPQAVIPIQVSQPHSIPCYQRFQWLNSKVVVTTLARFLKPNTKGRKGYDKIWMFQWLMYKHLMNCSYRDLESMTNIDYSTFIKFRKRLSLKVWFEKTFKRLVDVVVSQLDSIQLLLDSSFVECYSKGRGKTQEQGARYSGFKEKTGFKLHSAIDYKTRLPLLQKTTHGVKPDIVMGRNLIRAAPKKWGKKVNLVAADKGFDAEDFIGQIKRKFKHAKVAIPPRLMNQKILTPKSYKLLKEQGRCMAKREFNKRTEIERYYSRKKRVFNLGEEKTRHLKNFNINSHITSVMEILEWLSKNPAWRVLFTRLYFLKY